jgi:hypothetical protein
MSDRSSLYDRDFQLWIEATVQQLRKRDFTSVDWENVIEEIESIGRNNQRELKWLLTRLLAYLLRLVYLKTENEGDANELKEESLSVRFKIESILEDSPSLQSYILENFNLCYERARKSVSDLIEYRIPEEKIITPEEALNEDWFPRV